MDFTQVRDVIVETLNCDAAAVTPEARLKEDLGADSLGAVELCMALEDAFDVVIDDDLLPTFKTVEDIMAFLKRSAE